MMNTVRAERSNPLVTNTIRPIASGWASAFHALSGSARAPVIKGVRADPVIRAAALRLAGWHGKSHKCNFRSQPTAAQQLTLAKKDMKKYPRNTPLLLIFFLSIPILAGCTRQKDRFWPDTQDGILQFTDPIVTSGDEERIISLKFIGSVGQTSAIRRLKHEFHVGDAVIVRVSVPVVGEYYEGGGWIFSGRKYYGKFGIAGDVTNVISSNPEVLSVSVNKNGGLVLSALAPGTSKVTVSAIISRRYADRRSDTNKRVFEDTAVFNVIWQ